MAQECIIRLEKYFLTRKLDYSRKQLKNQSSEKINAIIKEISNLEKNINNIDKKYDNYTKAK